MEENIKKNTKKLSFLTIFIVFFVIFSSFLLISCGKEMVPPEEISISQSQTTLFLGQRKKLYVDILPTDAYGYSVEWSSSAPKTVSVDKLGYIEGLKYGSATIVAKIKDSDIFAECKVLVNDGNIVNFTVDYDYKIYYEGQKFDTTTLNVYAIYESGKKRELDPSEYIIEMPETLSLYSEIKISYSSFSTKTIYPLVREDFVSELEVTSLPAKTSYIIGENFDTSGLEITLVYASGKREVTQDYTIKNAKTTYKQSEVVISYENLTTSTPISTHAQITVNSISSLQKAIDDGYTSIMLASASYNTTTQIILSAVQDVLIFGASDTSINGYNIIPIKIQSDCGNITLADLTLTTIGDTPADYQLDLSACTSGNIFLKSSNYNQILHSQERNYLLNVI